ncbi:restriction endonuclease subunit S [Halomonas sp. PGE1]|uniref:restriction endonuclease subunit S n=1 Tax=Halomonas sp. PGE1 TaxID=2730360 RepID=UPI001475CBEC|nr:restriction endonuclease subunit S [Halomonas sp. PGE1]QJQ98432.1 hypothetical protein HIR79_06880 [Halomonas sp. PGE1]
MSWPLKPLNELCLLAVDCVNKTAPVVDYDTGYRMIRTTNIKGGFIDLDNVRYVTEEVFEKWTRRSRPQYGDVILTREAPVGEVGRFTEDVNNVFLGQRLFHYRPDPDLLDWNYLAYALLSRQIQGRLKGMGFGATVDHIRVGDAETLAIPCPPLPVQRSIGSILASYDDLIENNQRRIQLLEESARLLYKEWFVHLRFPGREHVKVTNGVPEGWSRRRLVDVTSKIGSGATPKGGASAYQPEGIALIRSQNVYDYRFDSSGLAFINDEQADRLSNVEVNGSDVLLNITGASVGRCCLAPDYHLPARVNQHVMIIRSDSEKFGPHYLLHFINSYREKQRILAAAGAGGSTREALTKSFVQNLEVTLPSRTLMEQFEDFAKDCFEQKQKLEMQNIRLAKARDLLLPKLMSGELAA